MCYFDKQLKRVWIRRDINMEGETEMYLNAFGTMRELQIYQVMLP